MSYRQFLHLLIAIPGLFLFKSCGEPTAGELPLPKTVDFNFHIKPILSDRCYACHGPDDNQRKAELSLHTEAGAFAALKNNEDAFVLVPGKPEKSELYRRIVTDNPKLLMPPPESNLTLSDYEKKLIRKWIDQGAKWKKHWSFTPPQRPELPEVKSSSWCAGPIDYFTLKKMEEKRLQPASEVEKEALLRRVTFDLTGLPPTPEELEAFIADESTAAYEKVVDRLLASPAYGERMASEWLDIARYSDSHGYQDDRPRTMWPWRDWVIRAFNDNLPYDEFVTWQIAGDLLPEATYEQKLATGFNRNHAITQEGGVVNEEYLAEYAADRTQTFATAFLGLTMECARCHNHKFDPISQEEYYQLSGFFNNIPERGQISYFDLAPEPSMPIEDPLMDSTIAQVKAMIERLEEKKKDLETHPDAGFEGWLKQTDPANDTDRRSGLIANFDADDNAPPGAAGPSAYAVNVNLPPSIEKPEKVAGHSGSALEFNGANFLTLGEIGDFDWHDDFSFGGWIRHSGAHRKNAAIFGRRNGEQKRQGYDLVLTPDNRLAARLIHEWYPDAPPGRRQNFAIEVKTRAGIPKNAWTHVFVTYQGNGKAAGFDLYLNGRRQELTVTLDSLRGHSILNGNDFLVGNWNHRARELATLYGFKGGAIDEVRIYDRRLSPLEVQQIAGAAVKPTRRDLYDHYLLKHHPEYQRLVRQLDSLYAIDLEKPRVMIMQELDTVKATFVLERGQYDQPSRPVVRGTPKAVLDFSEGFSQDRLGLARWLFDPNNPLTARVEINRLWQQLFGRGFVATPEDFGYQGALPSHPELLDWLAVDLRESGWDIKAMIKKIVLSSTYRQSSKISPASLRADPKNQWLSRGPNQRLTAEMVRDQALLASGLLDRKTGGKWVKPYQPAGIWKEMANQIGENKYRASRGAGLYRRSLYSYWKRTIPPPSLLIFDAAERAVCTVKRQQTSTPLQSLTLLNDPQYVEASRKLAEWALLEHSEPETGIRPAFRRIVSRLPLPREEEILTELFREEAARFEAAPENARELLNTGASAYNDQLDVAQLAALTIVVNTIFNLDEAKFR